MMEYKKSQEPRVKIGCNFYNRGFCRRCITCDFEHPVKLCDQYKLEGECSRRLCKDRHIKCKYFQSQKGCLRGNSCKDLDLIDAVENVEIDITNDQKRNPEEVDNQIKIPAAAEKDTMVANTSNKNVDNNDDAEIKNHSEVLGDYLDGFLLLENAIADGIKNSMMIFSTKFERPRKRRRYLRRMRRSMKRSSRKQAGRL
jgi:hypothetical protein